MNEPTFTRSRPHSTSCSPGHPPVQAKDAAEALARIASEPAPPLRGYCPNIPRALEAVIHRGLERDPARRWRNLQEFHDALVPFVPDRLSIAGIGLRFGAYVADLGLAYLVTWAIIGLIMLYHQAQFMETLRFLERNGEIIDWLERILWPVYFTLLEGIGGASLGKWLAGLRVNRVDRGGPPGLGRGLVRGAGLLYLYGAACQHFPRTVAGDSGHSHVAHVLGL